MVIELQQPHITSRGDEPLQLQQHIGEAMNEAAEVTKSAPHWIRCRHSKFQTPKSSSSLSRGELIE